VRAHEDDPSLSPGRRGLENSRGFLAAHWDPPLTADRDSPLAARLLPFALRHNFKLIILSRRA
jgi:hypothetical protein